MGTIANFLKTGQLGTLRLGMGHSEVRAILGEPPQVSVKKKPQYWEFDALGMTFRKTQSNAKPTLERLILNFTDDSRKIPTALEWNGWMPNKGTTIEEFKRQSGCSEDEIAETKQTGDWTSIRFKSGVIVQFEHDQLSSMSLFADVKTKGQQLSVFVPQDALVAVQKEAETKQKSPSQICSEWIVEKAQS